MDTDFTRAPRMIDLSLITTLVIIFACAPSQMLKNASDDLFLTRVEKSFALTAGPQVELNFETCSIIIKTSFSYAAAFRSVYTSHNN
ncbi:uncharacterized protein LOC106652087 isoform X2 [Trichogramma pretiosum]|uniref:uncharacterized protein LOC106652087 isoform X2 n=1 Tax=Trichogramma pretiosum TaxID=7493 RepID=UPI0006C9803C|nr:uncharacterized protein LOC106652087 isoform X2 [Trichogramma pretiosum]